MAIEPDFALAALRLRLELAAALTTAAARWAADPGLDEVAAAQIAEPYWCVRSMRTAGGNFCLRAVIPEQQPAHDLVCAAFGAVLGRVPDGGGLKHYTAMLERRSLGDALAHLAASPEAAQREEVFAFSRAPPPG